MNLHAGVAHRLPHFLNLVAVDLGVVMPLVEVRTGRQLDIVVA